MTLNGSEVLGEPELAGVQVCRLGTHKATLSGIRVYAAPGTIAGSAVWSRVLRKKLARERELAATSDAPDFDARAYLAVTGEELALIAVHVGKRLTLEKVLAAVPRSTISAVELGKSGGPLFSNPLTVTFSNGERWLFEVPRVLRGRGRRLVGVLAA